MKFKIVKLKHPRTSHNTHIEHQKFKDFYNQIDEVIYIYILFLPFNIPL